MRRSSKERNIPEPGVPESFKVLLKELSHLHWMSAYLRDDNTEVKIMESVDYGETDLRHIIEGETEDTVMRMNLSEIMDSQRRSLSEKNWKMLNWTKSRTTAILRT